MLRRRARSTLCALVVVALGSWWAVNAQTPTTPLNLSPDSSFPWMVGGTVNDVERVGNTLYLGGDFRAVAPRRNLVGGLAILSPSTGRPMNATPLLNGGDVSVVLRDHDTEAWFVAGRFRRSGGAPQESIVRFDDAGRVTFSARIVGRVHALALGRVDGDRVLFAGGEFTHAGLDSTLLSTTNLAAFRLPPFSAPSMLSGFDAAPDGAILSMVVYPRATTPSRSSVLYVGGEFTAIGGAGRRGLAAVDPATGAATNWNPVPDGRVRTIAPSADGTSVFVGGDFRVIGGQPRDYAAALDASTGSATGWNPRVNGLMRSLVVDGSRIWAGGDFTMAGTLVRQRVAQFNLTDGEVAASFDAALNGPVHAIAVEGPAVHVGGAFTAANGQPRLHLAAFNAFTGAVYDWNPSLNDTVRSIDVSRTLRTTIGVVGAGGDFDAYGAVEQRNLAAIHLETGDLLPWQPSPDGPVHALQARRPLTDRNITLYVVGDFTTIGGQPRGRGAAFVAPEMTMGSWNPQADAAIRSIAIVTTGVLPGRIETFDFFMGGDFTTVFGQSHRSLYGAGGGGSPFFPSPSCVKTTWASGTDGRVLDIRRFGQYLYVTGAFSTLLGQSVRSVGRVNCSTGAVDTAWTPAPDGEVRAVEVGAGAAYVGGLFTTVGGNARANVAAVDLSTGAVTAWQPNPDGAVNALALAGTSLYVGGTFTSISPGRPSERVRAHLAALDTTATGPDAVYASSFVPHPVGPVMDLDVHATGLTSVGGSSLDPSADDPVSAAAFFPRLVSAPPGAPTASGATQVGQPPAAIVALRWGAAILGPRPDRFLIEAGTSPGATNIAAGLDQGSRTNAVFSQVPAGTYYLRARAQNAFGTSPASPEIVLTVGMGCSGPPDPPANLVATVSGSLATLRWTPVVGSQVSAQRLEAGVAPGAAQFIVPLGATAASYSVAAPAGVYYARVRTASSCGTSLPSGEVQIVTGGAAVPPPAPFNLQATLSGNQVSFSWTAPTSTTTLYQLEAGRSPGQSDIAVVPLGPLPSDPVLGPTFAVSGVPSGTYYVRVRARSDAGTGPPSDEILVVVP